MTAYDSDNIAFLKHVPTNLQSLKLRNLHSNTYMSEARLGLGYQKQEVGPDLVKNIV